MTRLLNVSVLATMFIAVLCVPGPSRVEAHATTTSANALTSGAQIDAYLTSAHFSGYVLLERHGHVILSKGYGMADKAHNVPNTVRSKWLDAGANRFMTAIAVLKLQDEKKLSTQDKLCTYISPCPSTWRPITIHQLLLDTSGMDTFDTSASPGGIAQAMARCRTLRLVSAPGSATQESRCNNLLLNSIIVKVSGKPWAAAMQTLIFGPAHMTDSGRLTNAVKPPQRVQGYSSGAPTPLGNFNNYYSPYSSIEDLERMDRALLAGHLISRTALHALFTPYLSGSVVDQHYNGSNGYGLARGYECYIRKATGTTVRVVDKPGDVSNIIVDNALSPDDGTIAIMAKNDDSGPNTDPTDILFGRARNLLWGT